MKAIINNILYLFSNERRVFIKARKAAARDFFAKPPSLNYRFSLTQGVVHDECHHAIESIKTLERLLTEKRLKKEDPMLRFLVDLSGRAWFARETRPNQPAPKHFQMTGKSQTSACCLTAGNLKFTSTRCRVLKNIHHRSGDFHPSFDSLRFFIAILVLNEAQLPFRLPKILVVKELDNDGQVIYKHWWSIAKLRAWTRSFSDNAELMQRLTNQQADTKYVHYKATHSDVLDEVLAAQPLPFGYRHVEPLT